MEKIVFKIVYTTRVQINSNILEIFDPDNRGKKRTKNDPKTEVLL